MEQREQQVQLEILDSMEQLEQQEQRAEPETLASMVQPAPQETLERMEAQAQQVHQEQQATREQLVQVQLGQRGFQDLQETRDHQEEILAQVVSREPPGSRAQLETQGLMEQPEPLEPQGQARPDRRARVEGKVFQDPLATRDYQEETPVQLVQPVLMERVA
jgi:hypothetical protein